MNANLDKAVQSSLPPAPYVGMRPFDQGEKEIFKGRDEDVVLLSNKVFAARLTILYGPSGVGKSSLLRTLLIEQIEKQDARAIYFDEWRGENPTATLKSRLIDAATELGISDADKGAPSLAHLGHLVVNADGRTLVLILDQFEEFFTAHATGLEPLRTELSGLVRAQGLDVRILISLREEHFAALEPFRTGIPELFESTYRLEPLVPTCVREAIVGPAKEFGVTYEDGLVDELIKDLRGPRGATMPVRLAAEAEPPTDLPILQLVCQELWNKALAKGLRSIPQHLYNALGRRQGIVDAYLRRVMPSDWSGRQLTAELMRYLAPPDGHKVALSAKHLASVTELPLERVKSELERLSRSDVRVLRTRGYEQATLYELWHDSFVRILEPWRDDVLWRWRRWRWSVRVASTVALIALAIGGPLWWQDQRQLTQNVTDVWGDSHRTPGQKFDHVAYYLLWSRSGSRRFEILAKELIDHERDLPREYGVEQSGREFITIPRSDEEWPLELRYSESRRLDPYAFTIAWQMLAKDLVERGKIPSPLKIKLIADSTYPTTHVRLQGANIRPLELELEADEDKALITADKMAEPGTQFLQRFASQWQPFKVLKEDSSWFIVPRWSLPAWKASGASAMDGSGALAVRLAMQLVRDHPDALLTADAVELLLRKVGKEKPFAVAEARRVRGDRLTSDFQELARRRGALTGLPSLLDLLASHPDGSSAEIAAPVLEDLDSLSPALPRSLQGPPGVPSRDVGAKPEAGPEAQPIHRAYQEAAVWLRETEADFRVELGDSLAKSWVGAVRRLKRPLLELRLRVRDDVLRRFGITMPRIAFFVEDSDVPKDAFRIEVFHENKNNKRAAPMHVDPAGALERLRSSLLFRAEMHRAHLITNDTVEQELKQMNEGLRPWLMARYSLTDLKLILRGVIAPSQDEIDRRTHAWETGTLDQAFDVPRENTIRHPDRLLASLVFWSKVDGPSLRDLVRHLRATQQLEFSGAATTPTNPKIRDLVNQSLDALELGRVDEAEAGFARALKIDEEASVAAFLATYPQAVERSIRAKLFRSCQEFRKASLTDEERVDLEDLLAKKDLDHWSSALRRLRLCLLASYSNHHVGARRAVATDIVALSGAPSTWPADEAAWFGTQLLSSFDPLEQNKEITKTAFEYIRSALPALTVNGAAAVGMDVINMCREEGPKRWCWELLPMLVDASKDPQTPIAVADALAETGVRADAEQALRIADVGKSRLDDSGLSEKERVNWRDKADYALARAYLTLGRIGLPDAGKLGDAETLLLRLQSASALGGDPAADLVSLRLRQGRSAEADSLLEAAIKQWPDNNGLYAARLMLALSLGDKEAVSRTAAIANSKVVKDSSGRITMQTEWFALVAAVGLLMSEGEGSERAAREFLTTGHQAKPYVAMMLYWQMVGKSAQEAKQIIQRWWDDAEPESWRMRLREGDRTALREMLIGYYLQQVPRDEVFSDLEDQLRFDASDRRYVRMSREEMLCEAYLFDALLALADRDSARARASLERVSRTNQSQFVEYAMAKYLLQQM
jgi:Novel STAND NTPase 1